LAKGIAVCRPVFLVDVAAVDDVEVFEDRVTAAGHRQDAKQLGRGSPGPVTSHRRIMSAPPQGHNLAISAVDGFCRWRRRNPGEAVSVRGPSSATDS